MKSQIKDLNQLQAYESATNRLNELYGTDAGKKFVHHLINAFSTDVSYVFADFQQFKIDCLTGSKIYPLFQASHKKPKRDADLNESLINWINCSDSSEKIKLGMELLNDSRVKDKITTNGTKSLVRYACMSSESDKLLGSEELQALTEFIQAQVNSSNHAIIRIIKRIRKSKESNEKVNVEKTNSLSNIATIKSLND